MDRLRLASAVVKIETNRGMTHRRLSEMIKRTRRSVSRVQPGAGVCQMGLLRLTLNKSPISVG